MQQDDVSFVKNQILRNIVSDHDAPQDGILQSTLGHGNSILFDPTTSRRSIHDRAFSEHSLDQFVRMTEFVFLFALTDDCHVGMSIGVIFKSHVLACSVPFTCTPKHLGHCKCRDRNTVFVDDSRQLCRDCCSIINCDENNRFIGSNF